MPDPSVHHLPDCPSPYVVRFTGRRGDLLDRCRNCGRFAVVDPAPAPARVAPAERAPAAGVKPATAVVKVPTGGGGRASTGHAWPTHRGKRRAQAAQRVRHGRAPKGDRP